MLSTAIKIGSLCILRQITPNLKDSFAIDANIRIVSITETDERGRQIVEVAIIDPDGNELRKHRDRPMLYQTMLSPNGILYGNDGITEDGYFPNVADPWDMSILENLAAPEVVEMDLSRQLLTV